MKKGKMILVAAMVVFLCGCKQNMHTVATVTPTVIAEPTELQQEPILTPTSIISSIPEPELSNASAPTPNVTPALTLSPTPHPNEEATLTESPLQALDPLEAEFWCRLYEEDTDVLMSLQEISSLNEQNFQRKETSLVKLSEMEKVKALTVVQMIESYSFPNKKYYGNEVISEKTKAELLKLRNLSVLQDTEYVEVSFGILTQNADLRSFPAERPLTSEKNGRYDYLQETMLLINEPIVILHVSTDGEWCFVQGENYFGWIRESAIAYCEKETMIKHCEKLLDTGNSELLLVTKNIAYEPEEGIIYLLRMGTKLFGEKGENGKWLIDVPVRNKTDVLQWKQYEVSSEAAVYDCFHQGYLPYTRANMITLATELLDTPYAWGDALAYSEFYLYDSEIGMDCSSTVAAVYRCFGFVMPRNTGMQRASVWKGETVSSYNATQKKEVLDALEAGALLYSPGHVMLYLGNYEDEYYILHNTTTEFLSDGTQKSFHRCVISPMSLGKKGETILEQLLDIKVLTR